jgi:hypothetical protein
MTYCKNCKNEKCELNPINNNGDIDLTENFRCYEYIGEYKEGEY